MFANKLDNKKNQTSVTMVEEEVYSYLKDLLEVYNSNSSNIINNTAMNVPYKREQQKQIREALMKGYVEMSHINLSICMECEHAEYEAHRTTERLVSGG